MCGPRKHNCQPFCDPEGRFDCSDSVCSLRPAPLSCLCVRVRILGVLKIVCCCTIKPDCRLRLLWSPFLLTPLPVSCPSTTPLHYIYIYIYIVLWAIHSCSCRTLCELTLMIMRDGTSYAQKRCRLCIHLPPASKSYPS